MPKVIAMWENEKGYLEDENGVIYLKNPNDPRPSRAIRIGIKEKVGEQQTLKWKL